MADSKITTLIVDDEPPARAVIRRMLGDHPEVEVIGECATGKEAIHFLRREAPDLMFLDIQMPEIDGFALLASVAENRLPVVVFVTAFDLYAVKAFDVSAVDYLLKPFDHERFDKALQKAKARLRERTDEDRTQQMFKLLTQIHSRTDSLDRFVIKNSGRVQLVPAGDVEWIQADGNYLCLHAGKASHLIRETMQKLESKLDPKKFIRIHRSTIVNIDCVKELRRHVNDDEQIVILKNGVKLTLSRRFRERVSRMLGAPI